MKDNRVIKQVENYYIILDNESIYTCSSKKDLNDLIGYTIASETSKGICSETYLSKDNALKDFNSIKGIIIDITIFDTLEIGDTINYDMLLKNGALKNESMLILDKDTKTLKLNRIDNTWYCTKMFFSQLLNITIIK